MATSTENLDVKVERLVERREGLKTKVDGLRAELRSLATIQENAPRIEKLKHSINEGGEEIQRIGVELGGAKEERKRARLNALVTSPAYQEAIRTALAAAADSLAPWARIVELEAEARWINAPVPYIPASVSAFVVELRAWVDALERLNAIKPSDVPPGLKGLLEVGKR